MKKEFEFNPGKIEREVSLELMASKHYADIPFHNFDHIKDVLKYAEEIMEQCEKEGIVINKEVVKTALLFHDAGYHENHKEKGFLDKEAYSASIAQQEMEKIGYSSEFISEVKMSIMTTMKNGEPATNEQKLTRISDISNLFGKYEKFMDYNILLKKEVKYMNNKSYSWSEWKNIMKNVMEFYASQDKDMAIDNVRNEKIKINFSEGINKNLKKFLSEDESVLEQAQEKFEKNFYSKNNVSSIFIKKAA